MTAEDGDRYRLGFCFMQMSFKTFVEITKLLLEGNVLTPDEVWQ